MKHLDISLFLSYKNIEIVESILKNSKYSYEIFPSSFLQSEVAIIDYSIINRYILDLENFKKVICIIPFGYSNFIDNEIKSKGIILMEIPITYSKLINKLSELCLK